MRPASRARGYFVRAVAAIALSVSCTLTDARAVEETTPVARAVPSIPPPVAAASETSYRSVKDALGRKIALSARPKRVVTLIPSLGELAAELCDNHFERIIGVSDLTDYPPALAEKTSIGPYPHFNLEGVAALKPDLILASAAGNAKDQIDHLRELGLPVVTVRTESFAEIEQSMRIVGESLGDAAAGERLASRLKAGLAVLEKRVRTRDATGVTRKRVMLELGDDPLVVVGGKSFLSEALQTIGAGNAFEDLKTAYPRPSREEVVRRDPDAILVFGMGTDAAVFERQAKSWQAYPKLKAVRDSQVRVLPGDEILRPSLRLLDGLARLERAVYP